MIRTFTIFAILSLFIQNSFSQTQTAQIIDITNGGVSHISDDGNFVCGMRYPEPAFIWSESGGLKFLSFVDFSEAYGVSNNGKVAGRFYDPALMLNGNPVLRAGIWENGTWSALPGLDGLPPNDELSFTHAYAISADGIKVVGMQWHPNYSVEAVYWEDGIPIGMGQTYGENSKAQAVSFDGNIVAGWNAGPDGSPDRTAFYWDPMPHYMGGFDITYPVGECRGMNSDGSVIVGGSVWPFTWSAAEGMKHVAADSSKYSKGEAVDISDNGTIVGWLDPVSGGFDYRGFIKKSGWPDIVYLSVFIKDSLHITGYENWDFPFGQSISADGRIIGISAYSPLGEPRAIVLKINDPLPVELTSFSGSIAGSGVRLSWNTSTEVNNSGFEVQRKYDYKNWQTIGFVKGSGSSTTQNSYSFMDQNVFIGKNIYRLKQVDYNGSYEFSNEVEVEFFPAEYSLKQNYPNPFNPETNITFSIPQKDYVNITVFNSLGETIEVLADGFLDAGSHTLTFKGSSLSSGVYILKMSTGSFSKAIKMNLLK